MAKIAPFGRYRALDNDANPLAGGKLYTYEAGTTTPKDTYTDNTGNTANTNPVIMDANGYADVWLGTGGYKFVLKDANDVLQWTQDNIDGGSATGFASQVVTKSSAFNLSITEQNSVIVCTAALTVSLLPVGTAGNGYAALIINTSAGNVTLDGDGSETINGASTWVIPAGESITLHTDGLTWYAATGMLNDLSVTTGKIAASAVTTAKIADANVTTDKIADASVTATKLAATAVTAGSYISANITVDEQGRIIAASNTVSQTAVFQDQKSNGTSGGTFTSGAWRTRDLNTSVQNTITGASLSSNQITLSAGTYRMDGTAPGHFVEGHRSRLQNITDSTTTIYGTTEYSGASGNGVTSRSFVRGVFTISAQKTFEIQHWCTSTRSSDGFGHVPSGFGSQVEVYTEISIMKIG